MSQGYPSPRKVLSRQRGAALLVFMLIFFLASISLLLSSADLSGSRVQADQTSSNALAQAKAALLARAATATRPGSLPCPDFDDDGVDTNGSCSNTIGRLPWKTLGLADLRDGDGNRLWYVLATQLRNNSTSKINPAEPLGLSIDGTGNTAAIVFSPGQPLVGQDGRLSNDIKDYLDGANNDGGPYISGPASPTFNDRAIAISRDELFRMVNLRILRMLSAGLKKYYLADNANVFPETGADLKSELASHFDTDTRAMLENNNWYLVTDYESTEDRQTATLTISGPPAASCTITSAQAPTCTHQ